MAAGFVRSNGLEEMRRKALKTARDFEYSRTVIERIENAKTTDEISSILRRARG